LKIEFLYFDGCPNYEKALQILREVLKEQQLHAEINMTKINTWEEAVEKQFLGSPSIRINGKDIEGIERDDYGMKCRIYVTEGRLTGVPAKEMIVKALQESGGDS